MAATDVITRLLSCQLDILRIVLTSLTVFFKSGLKFKGLARLLDIFNYQLR